MRNSVISEPENIIYIFDEGCDPKRCVSELRKIQNRKAFLCPLTVSRNKLLRVREELSCVSDSEAETISFVESYHEKAFELKDEYIRFIAEFADQRFMLGKNVKEYFRFPFRKFSLWWLSLVSEKNTLKTDSYQRFVKLKTLLDLASVHRCGEMWFDIEDTDIAECLILSSIRTRNLRGLRLNGDVNAFLKALMSSIVKLGSFAYKAFLFRTVLGGLKRRIASLQKAKYILVTYFPLVDRKLFSQRIFVNRFYGPVHRAMERNYRGNFVWLAMMNRLDNLSWRQSAKMGRQVNEWGHVLFFVEEWLKLRDLFWSLVIYILVTVRFLNKVGEIKHAFRFEAGASEIWPVFRTDWYQSFCGKTLIEGILYYRAFSNFLRKAGDHIVVLYISEMHAWEKALNVSAREKQNMKTIAIQHSIVPLLLLNYFPHKKEMGDGDYVAKMPKPDYLGCVGKTPVQLFLKAGWDEKRVFLFGAIRSQHLRDMLENTMPWEKKEDKIVVALSYSPIESKEILRHTWEAFKEGVNYKVLIKGHPACPVEPIQKDLNCKLNPKIFEIVSTPLEKLLPTARAIIVNQSTAALEALACNCPVIVPRLMTTLDMNPLSGLSDLPIYVNSPQEMRKVVDRVIESKEEVIDSEKCQLFIRKYFEFLGSDEEFLDRIEKVLSIGA